MKELKSYDYSLMKSEFDMGNRYYLISDSEDKSLAFIIAKNITFDEMLYAGYMLETKETYSGLWAPLDNWEFSDEHFYILSPEEAKLYLNEFICISLT